MVMIYYHLMRSKKIIILLFFICLIAVIVGTYFYYIRSFTSTPRVIHPPIISPPVSSLRLIKHVFVIIEENHDWNTIYKSGDAQYINSLSTQGTFAQNFHNVSQDYLHPSEPNYIFLEAGTSTFLDANFTTDNPPSNDNATNSSNHLVGLLQKNGLLWKSYQEDITGLDCPINPIKNYVPKHNPFIFFTDVVGNPPSSTNTYCIQHIRPITELQTDITQHTIANYTFITPNLQHDMHDGSVSQADTWLSQVVPIITQSDEFKKDGVLFITWDEGNEKAGENNPIGLIAISPFIKTHYSNTLPYSHASILKTIEEIFHLSPLLGKAADSTTLDLADFFK